MLETPGAQGSPVQSGQHPHGEQAPSTGGIPFKEAILLSHFADDDSEGLR